MTRLRFSLVLIFLVLPSVPVSAQISIPGGLAVVTDEFSLARTGSIAEGEVVFLKVVATEKDAVYGDGWRGAQFAIDVDPRLQVLGKIPSDQTFFSQEVAPNEWVLSFDSCIDAAKLPFVLMTYVVQLPVGETSIDDLRVGLKDLVQYGESMMFVHCADPAFLDPPADLGGVVLNPTAPSIVHFSPSSTVLVQGRQLWLGWTTFGSTDTRMDGSVVVGSGTTVRTPSMSTTYVLTASDGVTSLIDSTRVEVIQRPRVDFFTAEAAAGVPGSVNLKWSVTGSSSVVLDGVGGQWPIAGTLVPEGTGPTWTLRASNEWGTTTVFATLGGGSSAPIIGTFVADPDPYFLGEPVTLTYSVFDADTVSIDQGVGSVDPSGGDVVVTPTGELQYTLTATNAFGSSTASVWVTPGSPVIQRFDFDPPNVLVGSETTMRWKVRGATDATILPDFGTVAPDSGSIRFRVDKGETYTLKAWNSSGASQQIVDLGFISTPITKFDVEPHLIYAGDPVALSWTVYDGFDISVTPDIGPITVSSGTRFVVPPADSTVYSLTATNADTSITVTGNPIVWKIPYAEIRPPYLVPILYQVPIDVEMLIQGAQSATLEPGFGPIDPAGGVFPFTLSDTTLVVLTATNPKGTFTTSTTLIPDKRPPFVELELVSSPEFPGDPFEIRLRQHSSEVITVSPFIGNFSPLVPGTPNQYTTSITEATTFVATATNRIGTTVDSLLVTLPSQEPQVTLAASPTRPFPASPLALTVSTVRADSLVLEPGFGSVDPAGGVFTTSITDSTVFTATAFNAYGQASAQLGVGVETRLPAVSLSIQPTTSPFAGQAVQLDATVARADSAWIEPASLGLTVTNGSTSRAVSFDDTTHVVLHAVNPNGQSQTAIDVTPRLPVATLTGPTAVESGSPAVLTVTVEGASAVTLSPGFGNIAGSGNYSTIVRDPTTFVLLATNPLGSVVATHHVAISKPRIERFAASETEALAGEPVELSWQVAGADSIEISDGQGLKHHSLEATGTITVVESTDRSYVLTAFGMTNVESAPLTVGRVPLRIESFTAAPSVVAPGSSATLQWSVVGVAQVEIDTVGPVDPSGTAIVVPDSTTTYTLTARNGTFVRRADVRVFVSVAGNASIELSWSTYSIPGTPPFISPFVPFTFYVLATDVSDGMLAYEFGLDLSNNLILLNATIPYPNAVNVGQAGSWVIGAGDCVQPGAALPLLEVMVLPLSDVSSSAVRLRGSIPSSFEGGVPGYYSCTRVLRSFNVGPPLGFQGGGGGVPVVRVSASAHASTDGVWIEWQAPSNLHPRSVRILRQDGEDLPRVVARLDGASQGRWLDREGPTSSGDAIVYRVIVEGESETVLSAEISVESDGPPPVKAARSHLLPNIPNPFNPSTDLRFELSHGGEARLEIYDAAGRHVWSWSGRSLSAGRHSTTWMGRDDAGRAVSSGVYLVQLSTNDGIDTQRIVLVK